MNTAGIAYDAHGHEIVLGSRTEQAELQKRGFKDILQTYTGKVLQPLSPAPGDFNLEDIAWSLSQQCRYNGHTKLFYSVATHCILVARFCPDGLKRDGLLHDASEAYLSDLPSPMKARMPEYQSLEKQVEEAIAKDFRLRWPMAPEVKAADDLVFRLECRLVMGGAIEEAYALRGRDEDRVKVESYILWAARQKTEVMAQVLMDDYRHYERKGL